MIGLTDLLDKFMYSNIYRNAYTKMGSCLGNSKCSEKVDNAY